MDAGGNGSWLAEQAAQRYGFSRIDQVKLSEEFYRENMPRWKAGFEDDTIRLPRDADVLADHRAVKKVKGVGRLPDIRQKDTEGKKRHGDSAIASFLAYFASCMEVAPIEFEASGETRTSLGAFEEGGKAPAAAIDHRGFGRVRSGTDWRGY